LLQDYQRHTAGAPLPGLHRGDSSRQSRQIHMKKEEEEEEEEEEKDLDD
jgi:hypothetical protein